MTADEAAALARNLAERERALAKATRRRLGATTTAESEAAVRAEIGDLIAVLRAALPRCSGDAQQSNLEQKIARHEAHLARMTPCAKD